MRRILIIVATLIVVLGVAVGVYFFFFAPKSPGLTVGGNPFENVGGEDTGGTSQVLGEGAGTQVSAQLLKVTDGPVAPGFVARGIQRESMGTGTTTSMVPDVEVRYVERASGNTYAFMVHGRSLARLTNKTLPGIQEASWLPDGSMAYVRFLSRDSLNREHVSTYALPATGEGGYFLEEDLTQVRAAGSSTLFTLLTSTTGTVGTVAKGDGTGARTLFTSLLSSIMVEPTFAGYFAYTAPSAQIDGYGFTVSNSGSFARILGPLRGLSILPAPNAKNVLYSYIDQGTPRLAVLDVASRAATALPLTTMAEKCVWTRDNTAIFCAVPTNLAGTLPDDWYQGAVTFADRIWRIDLAARTATLVADPGQLAKTPMDLVSLTLDSGADTLTFMDRTTGSLWVYDL